MAKLTKQEIQYIKDWYGIKPAKEIANDLGRTTSSIYHKASRLGLKTREYIEARKSASKWSKKDEQYLIENYSHVLTSKLQEVLGRSQDAIHLKARKLDLEKDKTVASLSISLGKSVIKHNYFKAWSPNMAYILGFIYSDGNLSKEYTISICQHKSDAYILEEIKNKLGCDNRIVIRNNRVNLSFGSTTIMNDLKNIGLTPNKSLTVEFLVVPKEFLSHFIRGYFDGDGTISHNKARPRISFYSGSKSFLTQLSKEITDTTDIPYREPLGPFKGAYSLQYSGVDVLDLGKWIYKKSGLKLLRKYKRYISHEDNWRGRYEEIISALNSGKRLRGVSNNLIKSCRRHLPSDSPFYPRGNERVIY